jgi:hypothetical protein
VNITKNKSMYSGVSISLRVEIVQHTRDINVLEKIIKYLGCGNIYSSTNKNTASVFISKLSDIIGIIIPFFGRYAIQGSKIENYLDFCRVATMMRDKVHTTQEGFQKIAQIKSGMNKKRERVYEIPKCLGNVESSSSMFKKHLYLYDANSLVLIKKFVSQRELIKELKIS